MRILTIAAAALLMAGAAYAADKPHQNNPSAIPEVHTGAGQTSGMAPQNADPAHPQPGEGYRIPEGQAVGQAPVGVAPAGADPAHPQPGEGYRAPEPQK